MITKILKFEAEWCGPCKALTTQLENFPIEVERINVDESPEKVSEYDIRSVPTLIFLNQDGKMVHKHTGIIMKEAILKIVNENDL